MNYKGFDKDLKCRGFQYEIGKEYEENTASLCNKGFHACEYPLDCFEYYAPAKNRFCEVEIDDNGERQSDNTKVCGTKIRGTSKYKLSLTLFIPAWEINKSALLSTSI